jgi:hypothetical protein
MDSPILLLYSLFSLFTHNNMPSYLVVQNALQPGDVYQAVLVFVSHNINTANCAVIYIILDSLLWTCILVLSTTNNHYHTDARVLIIKILD